MKRQLTTLFLAVCTLAAQENKLFWDGRDWLRLERRSEGDARSIQLSKAAYLNGLLDGRLYDYLRTWPADSTLADSLFRREVTDYLTTSELVRSLDNFYGDPLNHYIPIASAVIIVNMRAQGQSTEMIDAYTQKSKAWINRLTVEMQKEDLTRLMTGKRKKQRSGNGEE
ncbi:MAG: hypothetical protein ACE5LH_05590 [Fidelibacterota bacterium]